jgi:hypothetical protein
MYTAHCHSEEAFRPTKNLVGNYVTVASIVTRWRSVQAPAPHIAGDRDAQFPI